MAEKKVIELEVKTESVGNLKSELRKAQAEVAALAEKFGATSQEAIQAAKKAAELKDAIADAKALTDAYNPDAKFNALASSIGGVLNGFQAFEGALGLVGIEGENVQEALLKVQSAMALTQGINGVLEAKEDFQRLGKQISDVYSGAVKGFQNMTAAGKAFAVTGIGLLITGLGLVIAYWDDIKQAVGGVSEEEKKLAEFRRKHEAERRDFVAKESAGFAMALSQLKATNEGSKERSKLISEINQKYGTTLKNLSDEKAFQQQINDELKNYLAYQTAKFKLQANEDAIIQNLKTQSKLKQQIASDEERLQKLQAEAQAAGGITGLEATRIKGVERVIKENEKALADAEKRFENYGEAALKAGSEISKLTDNGKKYVEQNKEVVKTTKEAWEKEKELGEKRIELGKKIIEELNLLEENRKNKEAKIIAQSSITKEELYKREADRINKLREDEFKDAQGFLQAEIIQDQYNFQARLDLLELQRQKELQNKELTEGEIAAIEAKYSAERKKISEDEAAKKQENQQKALNAAKQSLQGIADLAALFAGRSEKEQKKAFAVQKAANIAIATMDTFSSAQAAYKSVVGVPVVGPALAIAAAAAAVAAGLLNIKKISATKFESNSAPSPSSPSGGADGAAGGASNVIAPNFNIVGNTQATNPLAGLGGQPLKAYVVSGEVTTAQSLDRNRVDFATF